MYVDKFSPISYNKLKDFRKRGKEMNGFKMTADAYRKAFEQGKIDKETAENQIKVLDFLGTCSDDDLYRMVDSTAFNEIIKTFCKTAIRNAKIDEDNDDRKREKAIMNELKWLFDEKTCREVLSNAEG